MLNIYKSYYGFVIWNKVKRECIMKWNLKFVPRTQCKFTKWSKINIWWIIRDIEGSFQEAICCCVQRDNLQMGNVFASYIKNDISSYISSHHRVYLTNDHTIVAWFFHNSLRPIIGNFSREENNYSPHPNDDFFMEIRGFVVKMIT